MALYTFLGKDYDGQLEDFFTRMSTKDVMRQKNFFSVLLDDTIRQTVCKLYFNKDKKYIGVFDENKKETKLEITTLDDIYKYSDQMIKTTEKLISGDKGKKGEETLTD